MTACAIYMGCNPIIFIGQDLAYTNERKYSSISESNNRTEKFEEVKSEMIFGLKMLMVVKLERA